jgi:hypothetical protein
MHLNYMHKQWKKLDILTDKNVFLGASRKKEAPKFKTKV